jgi:uncharacterized protein YrrD
MSFQSDNIRQSDLLHRLVLDRNTTDELGKVEVVWMDPGTQRVLGFIAKSGLLGKTRFAFNLGQLQKLGTESVVVNSRPVETDVKQVGFLETLIGHELWSESGDKLGKITDCIFNRRTGSISDYLFRSDGWRGFANGLYRLPVPQIISFGKKRVLVSEAATRKLTLYEEGLQQKLSKVGDSFRDNIGDRLKESYTEVTQELREKSGGRSLSEQAQDIAQQAKGRFQTLAEKAAQTAKNVSQQVGQQLEDGTLLDQVKDKLQSPPRPSPRRASPERESQFRSQSSKDREEDEPWI